MVIAALLILTVLCAQDPATGLAQESPQDSHAGHDHPDDFATLVELHSQPGLQEWMERHPWSIGTEVRRFLIRFDATRDLPDPAEKDKWFQHAAFLAEMLVDDALTPWIMAAMFRDDEQRSRFHTVRTALDELATAIEKGGVSAVLPEVDALRAPTAPEGAWETCSSELSRVAVAARSVGARDDARDLAIEIGSFATRARDGEIAAWSASFLGELALEDGDLAAAAARFGEAAAIESALGDERGARGHWRSAVDAEENLRLRSPGRDLGEEPAADSLDVCRQAAFAAARAGAADEAWEYAEILRARALARLRGTTKGPPAVEAARRMLADRQIALRTIDPKSRAAAVNAVHEAARGVDAALAEAERADPRVAILDGWARERFDPEKARKRLEAYELDALLGYVLGEHETLALTLDSAKTSAVLLPIGVEHIRSLAGALLDPIHAASRGDAPPAELDFDAARSRELYTALVEPLASALGARIGILPDGTLWRLPFEMLVSGENNKPGDPPHSSNSLDGLRFLIDDRAVAYLPAALLVSRSGQPALRSGDSTLMVTKYPPESRFQYYESEGVLRATRRTLAGGMGEVVTNLWDVEEGSAAQLKERFKSLVDRGSHMEALREMQIQLSRDSNGFPRKHPYYWAAWVDHRGI